MKHFPRVSLTWVLLAIYLTVSLVPFTLLVIGLGRQFNTVLVDFLSEKNSRILDSLSRDITLYLGEQENALFILSSVESFFKDSESMDQRILDLLVHYNSDVSQLTIIDNDNRIRVASPSNPEVIGLDLSNQPYVIGARAGDGLHISGTFISPISGVPQVALSTTLNNGFLYTLSIDTLVLNTFLYSAAEIDREYAFILDEQGNYIAHPEIEYVLQRQDMRFNPGVFSLLNDPSLSTFLWEDSEFLYQFKRMENTGWIVGFSQPLHLARKQVYDQQALVLFSLLLFASISILATILFTRWALSPLLILAGEAQKIGQGTQGFQFPKSRIRQVQKLADQLESMALAVQSRERELILLNRSLEGRVTRRTKDLNDSLENLKQTQAQLILSEKMAALGQVVTGVAHEMNTPIGVGVTAITALEDRLGNLKELYNQDKLKRSEIELFFEEGDELVRITEENIKRAAEIVSSFKQLAADQFMDHPRLVSLEEYIHKIFFTLSPELKKNGHTYSIQAPPSLGIYTYPGALAQVMNNLIMNSIMHGFEQRKNGHISLLIELESDEFISMLFRDDGIGLGDAEVSRIFDPFYTTKRGSGGTGLGLHITYNLITNRMEGSISCVLDNGPGLGFRIILPRNGDQ